MKVLLADDHDLVRDAIGALLRMDEPDLDLIAVKDLPEALAATRGVSDFDAVILDLRMPGMNGLVGVQKMLQAVGETPIMIMSGNASKADVQAALKIGVKGFVPKTLTGKSLINALRLVVCGETYVPAAYLGSASPEISDANQVALTDRETEVLGQLRQGNSNKEIALALDIAETTVKLHLRSISEKLNARNRTDIVVRAIEVGLA
ncbi:MAG: response regulator transcription factor [Pseudomonadota bacterium]